MEIVLTKSAEFDAIVAEENEPNAADSADYGGNWLHCFVNLCVIPICADASHGVWFAARTVCSAFVRLHLGASCTLLGKPSFKVLGLMHVNRPHLVAAC